MWPGLALTLALVPGLVVEVEDASGCLDAAELRRDLEASPPAEVDPATLQVRAVVRAEGDARTMTVQVLQAGRDEVLVERTLEVTAADCAVAPRALARIVRRQLAGLPRERLIQVPPPEPPAAVPVEEPTPLPPPDPEPGPASQPAPDDKGRWPFRLRPQGGIGVGGGVWPPLGDLRVEAGSSFGFGPLPDFVLALRGSLTYPVAVGDGFAEVASAEVAAGVAYEVGLPYLTLAPRALVSVGGQYAWGFQFADPRSALLPKAALVGAVAAFFDIGPFVELGVEIPLTALQLQTQGGSTPGSTFYAPFAWAYLRVGFAWGFAL